jgi:hypothetical protein
MPRCATSPPFTSNIGKACSPPCKPGNISKRRAKYAAWPMPPGLCAEPAFSALYILRSRSRDILQTFEARVSSSLTPSSTRVLVLGGDGVVGQALELLLRSEDYDVRFLHASSFNKLRTLDGVGLVLLCPGLNAEHRDTFRTLAGSAQVTVEIPVLKLGENPKDVRAESRYFLPWPCRAEDLKRRINAVLLARCVRCTRTLTTLSGRSRRVLVTIRRGTDPGAMVVSRRFPT